MQLTNKKILLAVTGGIAAYKAPAIVSLLRKQGAQVKVIMTQAAQEFVTPLTFQTISGNYVYQDLFDKKPASPLVEHIELAKWADVFVVAPSTANTIAKFALGIADDLLTSVYLAHRSPLIIVPAMNTFMLNHPATQENIQTLRKRGHQVLDTQDDLLACQDKGAGKMLEPEDIVDAIDTCLRPKDLIGKRFTITAGPTQEAIDPVRYLSNYSSGKMGYALANQAKKRGAKVTLISGPSHLPRPKVDQFIEIKSTLDLFDAVEKNFDQSDCLIKAAAPADFRPAQIANQKIKKLSQGAGLNLELVKNPDVALHFGQLKQDQIIVGFAAESQNELENGRKKLESKNFDLIVINNIKRADAGFQTDNNAVTLLDQSQAAEELPLMSKEDLANIILDRVSDMFITKANTK